MSMIVCFIDGIGLTSPAASPWTSAHIPTLRRLLGDVPHADLVVNLPHCHFHAIDATLGVAGLPQSGTGHTTLWTGMNAPSLLGRHFPAYPAPSQRDLIAEHSLFRRVRDAGYTSVIATVHRAPYWELVAQRQQRATAAALAAQAADLDLATIDDWLAGRAVTWDITGEYLQRWGALVGHEPITAFAAGQRLADLARNYDVVHYECYLPDFVGHRRIEATPEHVLELIDQMLNGIIAHLHTNDSLIMVSDHGNLEEPDHKRHTYNPVPFLVYGNLAQYGLDVQAIDGVTPWILRYLGDE